MVFVGDKSIIFYRFMSFMVTTLYDRLILSNVLQTYAQNGGTHVSWVFAARPWRQDMTRVLGGLFDVGNLSETPSAATTNHLILTI